MRAFAEAKASWTILCFQVKGGKVKGRPKEERMESDAPTESESEAEDEILSTRSAGKGTGGVIFLYCKMYFYLIYIPTTSN